MRLAVILFLSASLSGCTSAAMVLAGIAIQAVFHVADDAVTVFAIESRPAVPPAKP